MLRAKASTHPSAYGSGILWLFPSHWRVFAEQYEARLRYEAGPFGLQQWLHASVSSSLVSHPLANEKMNSKNAGAQMKATLLPFAGVNSGVT